MKKFRKIMAVLVAAMMIIATMVPAFAAGTAYENRQQNVTLTVKLAEGNADGAYDSDAEGTRELKYLKVFDAVFESTAADAVNTNTESGRTEMTGFIQEGVSYTIGKDDPWVEKLINKSTGAKLTDNKWFNLQLTAEGTRYLVTWDNATTDSTEAQKAAKWLWDNRPTGQNGTAMTYSDSNKEWTSGSVPAGYYLIKSNVTGERLIAATGDVVAYEKNTYPTLAKTQKDLGKSGASYATDKVIVQIGDTISYQVTTYIPNNASQDIVVSDTMTAGLSKVDDSGFTVTVEVSDDGTTYDTLANTSNANYSFDSTSLLTNNQNWTCTLNILTNDDATTESAKVYNDNLRDKFIRFTYSAYVDGDAAGTDTQKRNTATLTYGTGDNGYTLSKFVEYGIYATGLVKYDDDSATNTNGVLAKKDNVDAIVYLQNAKFTLQRRISGSNDDSAWTKVNTVSANGFYRPASVGENDGGYLISNSDGQVVIRGLDNEYEYRLVENEAPVGYNLALAASTLTLTPDTTTSVAIVNDETTSADAAVVNLKASTVAKLANKKGAVLPSTGGAGTTVLYIVGGMLVILAGAYLFFSRKRTA